MRKRKDLNRDSKNRAMIHCFKFKVMQKARATLCVAKDTEAFIKLSKKIRHYIKLYIKASGWEHSEQSVC